jgi:hypothetical protein
MKYPVFYFLGITLTFLGAIFKVMHFPMVLFLLVPGIIFSIIAIVLGLIEVYNSPRADKADKIMWTIALIFMNGIAGLIYLFARKKFKKA